MCLVSVKEDRDEYAVPARVVKRDSRRSPPRTRVSRAYYEEPQPQERTYIIQQPPQPPPVITYAPPFEQHEHSDHHSHHDLPPPPPSASERHSHHAGPQYVEVTPSSRSSSSSSSSSSDDHRSKTTSRSRTGPQSEYHLREKEVVRERRSPHHYTNKDDYATYQYVQPPRSPGHRSSGNLGHRGSYIDDPRASRSSYNARDIVVESSRQREHRY
jgi:hypothetical protein